MIDEYLQSVLNIVKNQYPHCKVYFDLESWINIDSKEEIHKNKLDRTVNILGNGWYLFTEFSTIQNEMCYYYIRNKDMKAALRNYNLNLLL